MSAQDNILCQFGLINLSSVQQLISQPILIHFWWELYHESCSLHTKEIKTGDSLCPAKVCHAKNIMKDIEDKMDTAVYVDNDESGIPDPINDDQVPFQDWTTTDSNVSVSTPCLVHVAAMICKLRKLPQSCADDDCNRKMSCLMTKRRNMKRNKKKEEHEKEQGKRKGRG